MGEPILTGGGPSTPVLSSKVEAVRLSAVCLWGSPISRVVYSRPECLAFPSASRVCWAGTNKQHSDVAVLILELCEYWEEGSGYGILCGSEWKQQEPYAEKQAAEALLSVSCVTLMWICTIWLHLYKQWATESSCKETAGDGPCSSKRKMMCPCRQHAISMWCDGCMSMCILCSGNRPVLCPCRCVRAGCTALHSSSWAHGGLVV